MDLQAEAVKVYSDDYYILDATANSIPFGLNINYLFSEKPLAPYLGLALGFAFYNQTKTVTQFSGGFIEDPFWTEINKISWNQNGFFLQPKMGFIYQISEELTFDFCIKYTNLYNRIEKNHPVRITSNDGATQKVTFRDWTSEQAQYLEVQIGMLFVLSKSKL